MRPSTALREQGLALWQRAEHGLDRLCGAALNPLRNLGGLCFMCFWLLAASGILLYAWLDTSAQGAYRSIDNLSHQPWYLGGWLPSLHRYCADAFVILMLAHLVREGLHGRYQGFRRFSWLTGAPLPLFVFASAIVGFWLKWDQLGQFSAIASAELLDALPLFASPMTRNFLALGSANDRLFSLFVFVHFGIPLLLLFGLWFHIQRINHAQVFPPRPLAASMGLALLALALASPLPSLGAADLARAPQTLALDWWLLFVHPLMYATSAATTWLLLGGAMLLLLALPWWPPAKAAPRAPALWSHGPAHTHALATPSASAVAKVDPANCNGCRRCFADCPFAAVTMVPHPDKALRQMAQVDADLCASCGICVGSCPSSTPFRSVADLVTGIDMPQLALDSLRQRLQEQLAALPGAQRVVVFGCARGARSASLQSEDVTAIELICTGMLPPSFVEYALRAGAAGVLVTGCQQGGCEYRLGQRWTEERLLGLREPHLRGSVPRQRWDMVWADAGDEARVAQALAALRRRVAQAPQLAHEEALAVEDQPHA